MDTLSNGTCLTWNLHTTNVMFEVYLKYCWKVENWYWFLVRHWDLYPFHQFADQVKYLQFPKQMTIVYQTHNVFLKWVTFANLHHSPKIKAIHTVSSQDFRSLCFPSFFLWKIMPLNFFCEIATFTSRLLSFDNFFSNMVLIIDFFACDFKPNFFLEAGKILERSQWIQIL